MKALAILMLLLLASVSNASLQTDQLVASGERIDIEPLRAWPLLHNGRIKPLETLAQEVSLFITGKYRFGGLHPVQFFFSTMLYSQPDQLDVIEVRSPELREQLKLDRTRRHFSFQELKQAGLPELAGPLAEKEKTNKRMLTELERKTLEAMEQAWLLEQMAGGGILLGAMDPKLQLDHSSGRTSQSEWLPLIQELLKTAANGPEMEFVKVASEVNAKLRRQAWPDDVKSGVATVDLEVFYNWAKPFRWACWLFLIIAILLLNETWIARVPNSAYHVLLVIPLLLLIIGFAIRISITGFAPVTNMYGTMIWVALGVGSFGWIFQLLYRNMKVLSLLYFGAFLILLLTEQIPLVISPDLDPIVAVLRSNLWLTIHVLTITISYAAFTIAMLLGNATMVKYLIGGTSREWIQTFGHYCYRAIQLGVFLLSAGIILGGVWADYSWGRFWGWDPKETWALIADLGFLVLLHSRFVGWVSPFRLLMLSPIAYLLVIMAWYGVNFILATGLHSYGFSSGGARIVTLFLVVQMSLFLAALTMHFVRSKRAV